MCYKILWALAWFTHWFYLCSSLCSYQASQALKRVFHRCICGQSPAVCVFELFFCFANGLSSLSSLAGAFLFVFDEQVWWITLPSPSPSWQSTQSSSRPTTIWSSRRNMRWVGQRSKGQRFCSRGIDFCLIVFSLRAWPPPPPQLPLHTVPRGRCLFLFPQVFSSRHVDNVRG